ncbi:hypothetical protein PCE1_004935 [Barthelona sp. PCE]
MTENNGRKKKLRKIDRYELTGRTLGSGSFSKVVQAVDSENNRQVAIKILSRSLLVEQNLVEQVNREIKCLTMLDHPHIVNLLDLLTSKKRIFVVVELMAGELFAKLVKVGKFSTRTARKYFRQLISALAYMHGLGIAHRDIKPENLLLSQDDNLKISDFGLSNVTNTDNPSLMSTHCGTPNYVAPEVTRKGRYDAFVADIWSCGVVLFVFLCGYLPFEDRSFTGLFYKIRNAIFTFPDDIDHEARDLIVKILEPNPNERITLEGIQEHPWFTRDSETPMPQIDMIDPTTGVGFREALAIWDTDSLSVSSLDAFALISSVGGLSIKPPTLGGNSSSFKMDTSFFVNVEPQTFMSTFEEVAAQVGDTVYDRDTQNCTISVRQKISPISTLDFVVALYQVSGSHYMVSFSKIKGPSLKFHEHYQVYEEALQRLRVSSRPTSPNVSR